MLTKYRLIITFLSFFILIACKSKTELYLERGLDILSNVKEINFNIYDDIFINEVGVIRDQKEGTKTLVFKLNKNVKEDSFKNDSFIGISVWIINKNNKKRKENWDFKPKLIEVNDHKYFLKKINVKEDRIRKMKIYAYQKLNDKKHMIGSTIILRKIYTYND
ncbi:hypothetical protein [Psychroflexus sp. ALD_RP9]|uniref:hypothetical protein n=1 Tax=Psychroflexus sp. ALD_RP9 TaxID=2777186 RepID=UPI001A8C6375|nr:hypothetical protein [Psychroflexus sp. ALD_RP9]QSS98170.1 hypothetical protein IMZ30_05495 [Psychroflexus sp. ALD_RP9]